MKPWLRYLLILLSAPASLLAQSPDTPAQLEKKANSALTAGLWELAELHLSTALRDKSASPEIKSRLTLRLAETLIRAGAADRALQLIDSPQAVKTPESSFWKAQALTAQLRYTEAAAILAGLLELPTPPHLQATGFTLASIQLALDQPDASLATLGKIQSKLDSAAQLDCRLYQVEILLDLGRIADAASLMPALEKYPPGNRTHPALLHAYLLLRKDQFIEAQAAFQTLITPAEGPPLSPDQAVSVALGLAETQHGLGNTNPAIDSLLSFLQERPDTHPIEPIFHRLIQWLPENPLANGPALARLAQWITPAVLPATGIVATGFENSGASAAWPTSVPATRSDERQIFALLARAIGLHNVGLPEAQAEAKRLLNRLRIKFPEHPLASHALYHLARWSLDQGNLDQAFSTLETLRESAQSPFIKGQATLLEARSAYTAGDTRLAIQLFDEAAATLTGQLADLSKRQSVIARLRHLEVKGTSSDLPQPSIEDPQLRIDLELEKAFYTTPPAATKAALENFLSQHPEHPRAAEARLAAIEATLLSPIPDLPFATAQLEQLAKNPPPASARGASRIAFARLQLADVAKDSSATLALAQAIMTDFPTEAVANDAALVLGRSLFEARNYNDARLVLEKLAASDTDPIRAQAAWLLAANSAALGGTQQSKDAALILYDKAIQLKGSLATLATLQKAERLIDMKRFAETATFLQNTLKSLPPGDPAFLPAGMLLGKALYAQGATNPAALVDALSIYDQLVTHVKDQPIWLNRLQYLRGLTLEQLPDATDPTQKRQNSALQAYLSVMEISGQPLEWQYFEQCGFRALAILEAAERWQAAISVAKKIASFKGPHAEDAALRASDLELKHPNW
jgi:TolA-binding protein